MRTANLNDRLVLVRDDGRAVDVEKASDGIFSSDPQAVFDRWDEFRDWAATSGVTSAATSGVTSGAGSVDGVPFGERQHGDVPVKRAEEMLPGSTRDNPLELLMALELARTLPEAGPYGTWSGEQR